ncbi:UbiA family prenyltransferase [Nocardioides sp. MAHUQ-72]|uniref:UbiA family prenyltransferase n=1 Tax=unclassified Nocardioides TaxID=2615069 RepID=UPI003618C8F8
MTALLRAAHLGPALAVVVLSALLGAAAGLGPARVALVSLAVLAGQLSVGWSNDLVDEARDRAVARADKPLAAGEVDRRVVRLACGAAVVATVVLSLACGLAAGLVHLLCVASAWAYNLGLKSTPWSWAPYAFSFGGLVVFVPLAGDPPDLPPWWVPVAGALLGVGAHLLNVLPDLSDDEATGVRGLPHRIGARRLPAVAVAVLSLGSLVVVLGAGVSPAASVLALGVVACLGAVALTRRGRLPFVAAVGIALTDVLLLLAVG